MRVSRLTGVGRALGVGVLASLSLWASWLAASQTGASSSAARLGLNAEARSRYSKQQTYSTALRFLRVDRGFPITEKDADAAYLLFEYTGPSSDEVAPGSVEIIETRKGISVFVKIPKLPSYHARVLLKELMRKLRREYGEPPPARKPNPEPGPDGGAPDAG